MAPPSSAGTEDDLDEVLDMRPRSRRRDRRHPSGRTRSVRRWQSGGEEEEPWDDVIDERGGKPLREKVPVFWRARDSLYFEPLVALAIIVVLLVSLFAYTANWPPVYVVESNSMQHGPGDHLGDINAGDIVLAQKVSTGSIVTYVQALTSGLTTYGSFGDVLLYYPNGSTGATPIIHRAIIYLQYDARSGTYNATGLAGLSCGAATTNVYYTPGTSGGCGTTNLTTSDTLYLYNVGSAGKTVTVDFSRTTDLGDHSGFLTLGDNNSDPDQLPPGGSPFGLSTLVTPGWVIGVARGMIPWFGALKLLLDGNAAKVPTASWEFLGLTIAGIIFAAAGLHLLLRRARGSPRRSRARYDDEEDEEADEPAPRGAGGTSAVRPWKAGADPPDEGSFSAPRTTGRLSYEQRRRAHFTSSRFARPRRRQNQDADSSEDGDDSETGL
jgi:signal peptidase I